MPVYEYGCSACNHSVEVRHGVHGHGPSTCPVCGGSMRKLMSAPTIVFKGSGWATKEGKSGGVRTSTGPSSAGAGGNGTSNGDAGAAAPAPATGSTAGSSPGSGSDD